MRHGSWMHHVAYVDSTLEIDGVLMVAAWVQHSRLRTRPSGGAGVRTARRARRPTRRGAGPTRPSCRAARSPRHAPRGPAAVIARASFGPVPVLRKVPDAVQGVPCRAVPGREVWFGSARESAPAPAAAHDRPVSTPGRSGSFATGNARQGGGCGSYRCTVPVLALRCPLAIHSPGWHQSMATWFLVAAPADCACFQVGPFSDVDHTNGDVTAAVAHDRRLPAPLGSHTLEEEE